MRLPTRAQEHHLSRTRPQLFLQLWLGGSGARRRRRRHTTAGPCSLLIKVRGRSSILNDPREVDDGLLLGRHVLGLWVEPDHFFLHKQFFTKFAPGCWGRDPARPRRGPGAGGGARDDGRGGRQRRDAGGRRATRRLGRAERAALGRHAGRGAPSASAGRASQADLAAPEGLGPAAGGSAGRGARGGLRGAAGTGDGAGGEPPAPPRKPSGPQVAQVGPPCPPLGPLS